MTTSNNNHDPNNNVHKRNSVEFPGTFATLKEACEKAADGTVILIQPGKYELPQTITLSKNITLRGNAECEKDVVIDCPTSHAFEISGGSPSFQNLTVSSGGENCGAFCVTGGTPSIFCCTITSRNGAGMYVRGKNANPQVEACVMKKCGGNGLLGVGFAETDLAAEQCEGFSPSLAHAVRAGFVHRAGGVRLVRDSCA